jgi:hypothetical protein
VLAGLVVIWWWRTHGAAQELDALMPEPEPAPSAKPKRKASAKPAAKPEPKS